MNYGRKFWERNPKKVAEELIGAVLTEFHGLGRMVLHGIVTECDSYLVPSEERQGDLFSNAPGTIGVFASRRGAIPVISAHEQGKTGVITLRKIVKGEEVFGPIDICRMLDFESNHGSKIATVDSGLYVGETGIDYKSEGLIVVNEIPENSPTNRTAYFKFRRQ